MHNKKVLTFSIIICLYLILIKCDHVNSEVVSYHPRIWLTPKYLEILKSRTKPATKEWDVFRNGYHGIEEVKNNFVNGGIITTDAIIPLALAYQITGDVDYAEASKAAIIKLLKRDLSPGSSFTEMSNLSETIVHIAVGFDWLYDYLRADEKTFMVKEVNRYMNTLMLDYVESPWHGHAIRHLSSIGLWGYASYGDNSRAQEFIDHARQKRFNKLLEGLNQLFGDGGALSVGSFYSYAGNILRYVEAVYTATGEDLYVVSKWFKDRLEWWLLFDYPGVFFDNNPSGYGEPHYDGTYGKPDKNPYVGYFLYDDGYRGQSRLTDNLRLEKLMLINHFSNEPIAAQLQQRILKKHVNRVNNAEAYQNWWDFFWFNPYLKTEEPKQLSHYASGMGIVLMRSGWADDATWIFFKCGDIYSTGHQHWDQNSFSIFKKGDLAIKSGIYDGDGTADHVVNYFSRTIASNSILVYDPQEVFTSWRGTHYPNLVNDGGQKAYREMDEFRDAAHWKQYSDINDTGTINFYDDTSYYTYVCGDATNAYNNQRYCTPKVFWKRMLGKNEPKVGLFVRELIFLRPDFVVVFDRVNTSKDIYRKKWLLHFLNKPLISGYTSTELGDEVQGGMAYINADTTVASAGGGGLFVKTLLPEKRQIRLVGGKDFQDYWVFGRNVKPPPDMSRWERGYGEWRIEVEPRALNREELFLNVLYPYDIKEKTMPDSKLVISNDNKMTGAYICGKGGLSSWVVMFSKDKANLVGAGYKIEHTGQIKHLICNLKPDTDFKVMQNDNIIETRRATSKGILYFESVANGREEYLIKGDGL